MTRLSGIHRISVAAGIVLCSALATAAGVSALQFSAATMIIEYNASAEDIGIQFFLDSDGWASVEIFDPSGQRIFNAAAAGSLFQQGGGTELFLESVEPPIEELPIDEFFDRFPAGTYRFRGRTVDGQRLTGQAVFSHEVPAGPEVTSPVPDDDEECAQDVPIPVVIEWAPVTESISGDPITIEGYEVIVENNETNFDVVFSASAGTMVTIAPEVLEPGTDYLFEVLAIEEGGNQTITEGCFRTAE